MQNRLKMLYDKYMDMKHEDANVDSCEHQEIMKNLAMEMAAIEYLMKTDIHKHIGKDIAKDHDKLHKALEAGNWKWAMYLLVEDEINGVGKYLKLHEMAINANKPDWAMQFKALAMQEADHAAILNSTYTAVPYTHGTPAEQEEWNAEHTALVNKWQEYVDMLKA